MNMADMLASAWPLGSEDAELVSAVRSGSQEAFDRLLNRYHASVYNLVYRIVGDPSDAADTVQEVFLKVHRGLDKFQAHSSLKTWIFRIAIHEGCNYRRWWNRHRRRETSLETSMGHGDVDGVTLGDSLVETGSSPFELTVARETREAVDRALAELPETYRTAVVLRDLEDFTYEEIAETLQVSLGTVKSRVARGRGALKQRLAGLLKTKTPRANLEPAMNVR